MILVYQLVFAVTAFGASVVILSILFKKSVTRSRFDTLFGLMSLAFIIWAGGRLLVLFASTHGEALFWTHIFYVGSVLVHIFFLHTILVFLDLDKKRKLIIGIFYVNAAVLLAINIVDLVTGSGYFIKDVLPKLSFPYYEIPGPIYYLHLINYIFIPSYALVEMIRASFSLTGEKLLQLRMILFSSVLGFFGGNSVVPLVYDIPLEPFLLILVPFHLLTLTYGITKHHLFDVKVITTEVFTFIIWMALLLQIFFVQDVWSVVLTTGLFVLMVIFGTLLIRSVIREVDQRQRLQMLSEQLEEANKELKKLDVAKSEFISIAGHQLRAPLTVIRGYVSMALEGSFGGITKELADALSKVTYSAEQLVKLVASLLDLSRMESGRIKYEFMVSDFHALVKKVLDEFTPHAEKKGVRLVFENRAGALPQFAFDPDKMREVVVNLVDNAIKYSKEGEVAVREEVTATGGAPHLRLSVRDSGIGIKKEDIGKLFSKFGRTEQAQLVDPNGMGIGLYFVKRVVEDHSGRVWVESEGLGKGSTFFVEIPMKR